MANIYSQSWTAGAISQSAGWWSTTFSGSDAPISGYPELAAMEQLQTVAGAGPSGQNVVDKNGANYYLSGFRLLALGPLTNGQFDVRDTGSGVFHGRLLVKLAAAAMTGGGYAAPLILLAGGAAGTGGNTNSGWFAILEQYQDSGANFQWNLSYWTISGAAFVLAQLNVSLTTAPDVADNAWHTLDVEVVPATITGVFNGIGQPGAATAANDGSITFKKDGVVVLSATGIGIVINRFATTDPEIYFGRGLQVGDQQSGGGADSPGPVTNIELFYGTPAGAPPINYEDASTITVPRVRDITHTIHIGADVVRLRMPRQERAAPRVIA